MFKTIQFRTTRLAAIVMVTLLVTLPAQPASVPSSQQIQPSTENRSCAVKPEMAEIPFHVEERRIQSGRFTTTRGVQSGAVFSTTVQSFDAPWIQVQFGAVDLGHDSYVRLTGLQDGATQELTASLMEVWSKRSAMFKGDAIKVELFAAPDDKDVFFEIESAVVGDWVGGVPLSPTRPNVPEWPTSAPQIPLEVPDTPNMICGADDRGASNDQAIGRIVPVGCTGWAISNGAFLTAGHCFTTTMTQIQFNVPLSLADGTIQPPKNPNDQYPIDRSNVVWRNNGESDDWTVFKVNANATTTLTPPLAYGSFYRVFNGEPLTVRVTGYGVDGPAPCFGESRQPGCTNPSPPRDTSNQTQQTSIGAGEGRTGDIFKHRVDITGGNSGGPIIYSDVPQKTAVAIHTHGTVIAACDTDFNGGTAFTNAALATTINTWPGVNVRYVDTGYPSFTEDGTMFGPYNLVTEGVNAVPNGGIVSIAKGKYELVLTINKPVTLEAPVGLVVIGQP